MGQYYKPVNLDKKQFLHSHDYDNGLKLMEHSYIGNNFMAAVENLIKKGSSWYKSRIVWAGDYAEKEKGRKTNLYDIVRTSGTKIQPDDTRNKKLMFLKNIDKNEYVSLSKVPVNNATWKSKIHPLSLLTCEGNGQGGGDFFGEDNQKLIGSWARNRIAIQSHRPKNCKEIIFDLVE